MKLHLKNLIAELSDQNIICRVSSEENETEILTISVEGWYAKGDGSEEDLQSSLKLPKEALEEYSEFISRLVKMIEEDG